MIAGAWKFIVRIAAHLTRRKPMRKCHLCRQPIWNDTLTTCPNCGAGLPKVPKAPADTAAPAELAPGIALELATLLELEGNGGILMVDTLAEALSHAPAEYRVAIAISPNTPPGVYNASRVAIDSSLAVVVLVIGDPLS